jgi:hypothetical protein
MRDLFSHFWNKRNAYKRVFGTADGLQVLGDLRDFCHAGSSCVVVGKNGQVDTHATMIAEGRREVFLRIIETLNLTDEQLLKLKEIE